MAPLTPEVLVHDAAVELAKAQEPPVSRAVELTVRETTKGCDVLQAGFLWLRIGVPTLIAQNSH